MAADINWIVGVLTAAVLLFGAVWLRFNTSVQHSAKAVEDKIEPQPNDESSDPKHRDGARGDAAADAARAFRACRETEDGEPSVVRILYATDREPMSVTPVVRFGGDYSDQLRYGRIEVTIPPNRVHELARLETPSEILGLRLPFDPMKHVTVSYVAGMDEALFFSTLNAALDPSQSISVFIHGFRTTFEDAARRTAQLHYDLRFDGVPIMYSWASKGELGPRAYNHDREHSVLTAKHLTRFLDDLRARTNAQNLIVIAHSMGNQALMEALKAFAASEPSFAQIVLIAPDVNKQQFVQFAAGFQKAGKRTTLYGSRRDFALQVSRYWAGNLERAGDANPPVVVDGVDTIDVSDFEVSNDSLNHFLLDDERVLADMKALLDSNPPVGRRLRMTASSSHPPLYWIMN